MVYKLPFEFFSDFSNFVIYALIVDAMMKIKAKYKVKKNWQGDPCVPVDYSWEGLECIQTDNTTNSRVVSL